MKLCRSTQLRHKSIDKMSYWKVILASPQWFIRSEKLYNQFLEWNPKLGIFFPVVFFENSPHCSSKEPGVPKVCISFWVLYQYLSLDVATQNMEEIFQHKANIGKACINSLLMPQILKITGFRSQILLIWKYHLFPILSACIATL